MSETSTMYEWIKALHVIGVISWMAGMLYLPRLFVYHSVAEPGSKQSETFKVMERRLLKAIINPAMIATWVLGLWLAWDGNWYMSHWLAAKVVLVLAMSAAGACAERNVDIRTNCAVNEILIEKGRAVGVVTDKGEKLAAHAIVSNLHPKLTFEKLLDPTVLPADFRARIASYRSGSGSFRMNLALSELPSFAALPGRDAAEHHGSGIVIAPSLAYMERAFIDARLSGWSAQPIVEMLIPSTLDDSLAPPGRHVASLFCQHVSPKLPDGRSWDEARETVADLMVDTVESYAPGFKSSVIARQILSPLDLEREFGLVGGDIFHGKLSLDQLYSARPVLGHADYRSPIRGLYMCGASTHPGGGVTGAPGHNAAREMIRDFRAGRWGRA